MSKVYQEVVVQNTKKTQADIRYLIAYSLYKKQKKEFVEKYIKENGKNPKADVLKQFQDGCLTKTSKDNLYANTDKMLTVYGDVVFKSKMKQFNKIHSIVNRKNVFWGGVWQSIVGSFIFAVLILIVGLIINFSKDGGLKEIFRNWLE